LSGLVAKFLKRGTIAKLNLRIMAKKCDITGKTTQIGGKYSNRTRATQFNPSGKTKRAPNLQKRRIYVAELEKTVTIKVSTKGLRTIAKNGAFKTLKAAKLI
jgi:large subunit ribosomal protein L28